MKKIISNNRLIAIAFMTVFSLAVMPAAFANGGGGKEEVPAELKYIGNIKSQHLFVLNVTGNELNDEFTIFIRDEFGNTVYRENVKAAKFTKKFLFNTEEFSNASLEFEVYSKKAGKSAVYAINSNTRSVEEVVVNAIK